MLLYLSFARAIGRIAIPPLFKAGYTGSGALRILQLEGYGYRSVDFFNDWREYTQIEERKDFFSRMPDEMRPPRAVMVTKASPVGGKYNYRFRVRVRDEVTGKESYDYASVSTDSYLTKGEADEIIHHEFGEEEYEGYKTLVRTRLVTVLRRPTRRR